MKHKTLFRLMLKAIGVWIFAGALPSLVMYGLRLTLMPMTGADMHAYEIAYISSPFIQMAVGAYLFFGGRWIADKAIPGNRPYCHECGYDLTGAVGNVCNECGTPFRAESAARHE